MNARSAKTSRWRALGVLLGLCVLWKLVVILAPPADLAPDGQGIVEELWRGTAARDLLDGPLLPLQDYQVNHFSGGSLVIVLLVAPLYALLPDTVAVMRLSTLPFALLGVLFAFLVLDRYAGRRAGWAGGLLFALTSAGYSIVAATAWGTHLEGAALGIGLLYAFLRYHEAPSARGAFVLGAVAGFCVYFGYLALVLVATLLVFDFFADRRFFLRPRFAARLAGGALGLAPWLAYQVAHAFAGLAPYSQGLGQRVAESESLASELAAAARLVALDLPAVFDSPSPGIPGVVLDLLAYSALLGLAGAGWVFGSRASVREASGAARLPFRLSVILWTYPVLYVLAYVVSGFRVRHGFVQDLRYAMPLLPWLSLAAGVGFQALGRRPGWSARAALGALALVLAVSVAGTLARCDFQGARASWSRPGHADAVLASTIAERYHDQPERLESIARELVATRPSEQAHAVLFVIGQRFKFYALPRTKLGKRHASKEEYLRTLDRLRASMPPEYRPYFERPREAERIYRPEEREVYWRERGP